MSSPYHFSPRPPVAPHPTPSSASHYSLPKPRAPRAPVLNPYDKFTQPEFDAWIGDITGALRHALGQDEPKPPPPAENDIIPQQESNTDSHYHAESEESGDELVNDSFAEIKARRILGKGKARDPREGPGLRKGGNVQPIEIVSSDEEEEEEVQLSITPLDDEENDEEDGEEDEEEGEEEDDQYSWEGGQSSSQPLPLPGRRKDMSNRQEDEYENDAEYDEYEEYEEDEDHGEQPHGSSPQIIDILSDEDDEPEQTNAPKPRARELSYDDLDEVQEDEDVDEVDYEYSEEEGDKEIVPPHLPGSSDYLPGSKSGYAQPTYEDDDEELDEIVDDDDDEIQEIQPTASLFQPGRHLNEEDPRRKIRDTWHQSQMYAQEYHIGGESSDNVEVGADPLHLETEENKHLENDEHNQTAESDDETQPWSQNTAFPLENTSSPLEQRREVEIPDLWSGPRQYAQDYYSDGHIALPSHEKPDPSHLGPGDIEHTVLDAREEDLVNEIEEGIQPMDANTSFPPEQLSEFTGEIPDAWVGPQIYAEDYYSGGDIQAYPGERLDPFVLHGTGDLDDGIDDFLTPGALSPNPSNERTSANEDGESMSNHSEQYATSTFESNVPVPQPGLISVDDSDDEPVAQIMTSTEAPVHFMVTEEERIQAPQTERLTGGFSDSQSADIPEKFPVNSKRDIVTSAAGTISNSVIDGEATAPETETNFFLDVIQATEVDKPERSPSTEQIDIESGAVYPSEDAGDDFHSSPKGQDILSNGDKLPSGEPAIAVDRQNADKILTGEATETVVTPTLESHEVQSQAQESVVIAEDGGEQLRDTHFLDDADSATALTFNAEQSGEGQSVVIDSEFDATDMLIRQQPSAPADDIGEQVDSSLSRDEGPKVNIENEETHIEEATLNGSSDFTNDAKYTVIKVLDVSMGEITQGEADEVTEAMPITSISDPLDTLNQGDVYSVEVATEGRLTEEPHDRATNLEVVSVALEEVGDIPISIPVFERASFPSITEHSTSEAPPPEATSGNDNEARSTPSETTPEVRDVSPNIPKQESSLPHLSSVTPVNHVDGSPSAYAIASPPSTEEPLPLPPSITTLSNTSAVIEQTRNIATPQISGDARDFVLSSINEAFFSSNLPNYFSDFLPAQQRTSIQQGDGVNSKSKEENNTAGTKDSYEVAMTTVPTTHVMLTRHPNLPTIISDAYPYNLSTPSSSRRLTSPPVRHVGQNADLNNPIASTSTPKNNSTLQKALTPPASTLRVLTPEVSAPEDSAPTLQTTKTKPTESEDIAADTLSDGADLWPDLEFQYPPEQSIMAEFKDAVLPISQSSKAESEKNPQEAETTTSHLEVKNDSKSDTTSVKGLEASVSSSSLVRDDVADIAPPAISERVEEITTELKAEMSSKTAGSSKQNAKRKRDTSLATQISHDTAKPTANKKSKGRRASRSNRKEKSNQQTIEPSAVASEDTIHVRPRPSETSSQEASGKLADVFSAAPTYRILQSATRASPAISDLSDRYVGAQPSPTTSKSSKPLSQALLPLTSLFHAHGKGRKQQLLSNLPPKMMRQVQSLRSSPVYTSPTPKSPEPPTPSSIVNQITSLEIPSAPAVSSTSPIAPSDTSLTPVTPLPTSPATSTQVLASPTTSIHVPVTTIEPLALPTTSSSQLPPTHTPSHHSKPGRNASKTSSPVTRSHCRYHRISLPKEEGGPRMTFLVPGCSLNDKELMKDEEIEDHGDATVEDSNRMIKDIESLNFHSDLIGILRQLVGLDILREQEVFYLPQPGEEVPRKNSLKKSESEKSAMVRVPADSSSYAGSPPYSVGYAGSVATYSSDSRSPSISGLRSFIDSEKGSSFAPTDTEQSDGEGPHSKRTKVMGPPASAQLKGKDRAKSNKSHKSTSNRGVKRSRTETLNDPLEEGEPSSKKLKTHLTDPGPSPQKHV